MGWGGGKGDSPLGDPDAQSYPSGPEKLSFCRNIFFIKNESALISYLSIRVFVGKLNYMLVFLTLSSLTPLPPLSLYPI